MKVSISLSQFFILSIADFFVYAARAILGIVIHHIARRWLAFMVIYIMICRKTLEDSRHRTKTVHVWTFSHFERGFTRTCQCAPQNAMLPFLACSMLSRCHASHNMLQFRSYPGPQPCQSPPRRVQCLTFSPNGGVP